MQRSHPDTWASDPPHSGHDVLVRSDLTLSLDSGSKCSPLERHMLLIDFTVHTGGGRKYRHVALRRPRQAGAAGQPRRRISSLKDRAAVPGLRRKKEHAWVHVARGFQSQRYTALWRSAPAKCPHSLYLLPRRLTKMIKTTITTVNTIAVMR